MKILMFLEHSFPPDIRVEKEARTLLEAGHEIFLLCPNRENALSSELIEGINVLRIPPPSRSLRQRFDPYFFAFFFINPFWEKHLERIVEQERIDALHIHDLPMVKTGLSVARKFGIPIVADLHENYPAGIQVWRLNRNWRGRLVNHYEVPCWKRVERYCVRRADEIVTVIDEAKQHYIRDCGVSPTKITVVMNTEDPDYFCSLPIRDEIVKKYQPYFTISYIGGFGPHRGVQTAVSAMPKILREIPTARLLLVGSGNNELELKKLAKERRVEGAIEFTGQQPSNLVPSYITASQVCLIPYIDSAQTDASCPHKLFQYMAMGKPVIVSSMRSLSRIISETGAGLVYTAGDEDALVELVVKLHRDGDLANRLGEAGIRAVTQKYSWKRQGEELLKIYKNLWKM